MQKLQEFRARHELEWGYQAPRLRALGKRERGEIIHDQKSNAVADIAAVLAGAGSGNRMWSRRGSPLLEAVEDAAAAAASRDAEGEEEAGAAGEKEPVVAGEEAKAAAAAALGAKGQAEATASEAAAPKKKSPRAKARAAAKVQKGSLINANVYWSNDADLRWARKWTENVEHHLGLPSHVKNHRFKTRYIFETPEERKAGSEAEGPESTEVTEEAAPEAEPEPEQKPEQELKPEPEKKGGLFGWLRGKSGSSSADTRA